MSLPPLELSTEQLFHIQKMKLHFQSLNDPEKESLFIDMLKLYMGKEIMYQHFIRQKGL